MPFEICMANWDSYPEFQMQSDTTNQWRNYA